MKIKYISISLFDNGFNKDKFINEIETNIITNTAVSFNITSSVLFIAFQNDLTTEENTQIDSLVSAHIPEPIPQSITTINEIALDKDFNIMGFHKKEVFNSLGDLIEIHYYRQFTEANDPRVTGNPTDNPFTNLAVKEIRTYFRDTAGILYKTRIIIEWFDINGIKYQKKDYFKYFDYKKGYLTNKQSLSALIDKASMYLMQQLSINNNSSSIGTAKAKQFLQEVRLEILGYEKGDRQPLLNAIQITTNSDITTELKTALGGILNVNFV